MSTPAGVTIRTIAHPTVQTDGLRVVAQSRVMTVRLPIGGIVWHRPSAVVVEHGGRVERHPIVDVTRIAQFLVWACALIAWFAIWRWSVRSKEQAS
jgi:hypothetical protein